MRSKPTLNFHILNRSFFLSSWFDLIWFFFFSWHFVAPRPASFRCINLNQSRITNLLLCQSGQFYNMMKLKYKEGFPPHHTHVAQLRLHSRVRASCARVSKICRLWNSPTTVFTSTSANFPSLFIPTRLKRSSIVTAWFVLKLLFMLDSLHQQWRSCQRTTTNSVTCWLEHVSSIYRSIRG